MNIRWRIGVLVIQLAILLVSTTVVLGSPFSKEIWFFSGLLAVAINPQLLEPHYPKPGDVIGNSIIFLLLYSVTDKTYTGLGWDISAIAVGLAGLLAVIGVFSMHYKNNSSRFSFSKLARAVSQIATAQVIYSVAFILSLLEFRPSLGNDFWILIGAWSLIAIIGKLNWQNLLSSILSEKVTCNVESLVGPSILTLSASYLPRQGTWVDLASNKVSDKGLVIKRILRKFDVWGQVYIENYRKCEEFLINGSVEINEVEQPKKVFVGSVDAGTTDKGIRFIATKQLAVGQVVGVPIKGSDQYIYYQVASGYIENTDVKGGSHLFERAYATQLGVFDLTDSRFIQHPWVPEASSPILSNLETLQRIDSNKIPEEWEGLGTVIGTSLPVFIDLKSASTAHAAILGMTKMGKSTLAERLARNLSKSRRVTILDLTGEYVGKKGFPRCDKSIDWSSPGVSVFEPKPGEVPADRALEFLQFLMEKAQEEYQEGEPFPRTIIIDEAHQFIPEPAGLGFNAPGRDSSFKIGLLLMQVRKYGISVILISQRTAVVAKSALSQCENLVAFRSVDQTGLDYLEALAGGDIRLLLPRLKQGEALVFGPAVSSDLPVAINVFKP